MEKHILAKKISDILAKHYTRCWNAKGNVKTNHFSLNEKFVQEIEGALKNYQIYKDKYEK